MIKNIFFLTFFLSLVACGGVDFVLKEKNSLSIFKNNTLIEISNNSEKNFDEQLFSWNSYNRKCLCCTDEPSLKKTKNNTLGKAWTTY